MQGRVEGCRGIADATLNAGTGCCQPTEKYFEVVFASEYGEELSARVEPASSPLAPPRTNDLSAFRAGPKRPVPSRRPRPVAMAPAQVRGCVSV